MRVEKGLVNTLVQTNPYSLKPYQSCDVYIMTGFRQIEDNAYWVPTRSQRLAGLQEVHTTFGSSMHGGRLIGIVADEQGVTSLAWC